MRLLVNLRWQVLLFSNRDTMRILRTSKFSFASVFATMVLALKRLWKNKKISMKY